MAKMKSVEPSRHVIAFVEDLKGTIARHRHLSAMEMLAGASQLVGMLIALQDSRKVREEDAMRVVEENIQTGNRAAIETVLPGRKRE